MKFDQFDMSFQERSSWEAICPINTYAIVSPSDFEFPLPSALIAKVPKILIASSGYLGDDVNFYMANLMRVDGTMIDQNPFGLVFVGPSPFQNGYLIQHGNWEGRSSNARNPSVTNLQSEDLVGFRWCKELPVTSSGNLSQLQVVSQRRAFEALIVKLKRDSVI